MLLSAAKELRKGVQAATFSTASPDTVLAMPIGILFDFVAVHVIGEKAATADLRIDFTFTENDETWTMWIGRGVFNARRGASPDTPLTVTGTKPALVSPLLKPASAAKPVEAGKIELNGAADRLETFAGLLDTFDPDFAIVTP
ncbi:alkyl sulfatase C-terminal domain-containing protein [Streptomyces stackebrandtii]|uniref:alkyl sulfatase C-terminal domain-containing protein n=1 Tax=Streptomyces stackebrandtii TaxID=3051177 RepID=UPI0028DB05E5|nr:alkyl sulfatase C-terminal domain-containing protein [Streptomyces sp. DSM 40976]